MVSLIWSPTEATPEELRNKEREMSGLATLTDQVPDRNCRIIIART